MLGLLMPVVSTISFIGLNYGINKWINKSGIYEGKSKNSDVEKVFEKFLRKVKDYDKASILIWLPLKNDNNCGWKTVHIKGNENQLRKFFKTNEYSVLITDFDKTTVNLTNIKNDDYKFWVAPSMNCFQIDYTNTL